MAGEGMSNKNDKALEPTILVIFGITGDLSSRYLLPALFHLIKDGMIHKETVILGVTRSSKTISEVFENVSFCGRDDHSVCDPEALERMKKHTQMYQMDLDKSDDYAKLHARLDELENERGFCMNRIYYLSIPPLAYAPVIQHLGENKLNESCSHNVAKTRLLVEKPFGFDLESAEKLIKETSSVFSEEQIFRIDHYLAKETVQNILTFRFKNPIFEPLWNQQYIAGITISAFEEIGVLGRAAFYDPLGALRDFIQSHLIQIMAIATMDKPESFNSENIHIAKQELMQHIEPIPGERIAERAKRAQYIGYRDEINKSDSVTETYASLLVYIDTPRWQGVPIRLVTGKSMNIRKTEVRISFHGAEGQENNHLRFRIQPNEGIELDLLTKKPGYTEDVQSTKMDFTYDLHSPEHGYPDAYERVLVDAIKGDRTLFATSEEVLASWRVVQPVLDNWATHSDDLEEYEVGSKDLTEDIVK
ncbi:MAG: glucose-6-phosphate dehydrogenase [Candidatus Saccharimonadales bacterium]